MLKLLLRIFLIVVVACALRMVVWWYTPPDFSVVEAPSKSGGKALVIKPNWVVRTVESIEVTRSGTILASIDGELQPPYTIQMPPEARSGDVLIIRCSLQYDKPMPCITTIEHEVVVR